MEFLLYIFGNFCVTYAAVIILRQDVIVSRDTQIIMWVGSFTRIYWSCSSPAVWTEEELGVRYLCWVDLASSCVLWSCVVIRLAFKHWKRERAYWKSLEEYERRDETSATDSSETTNDRKNKRDRTDHRKVSGRREESQARSVGGQAIINTALICRTNVTQSISQSISRESSTTNLTGNPNRQSTNLASSGVVMGDSLRSSKGSEGILNPIQSKGIFNTFVVNASKLMTADSASTVKILPFLQRTHKVIHDSVVNFTKPQEHVLIHDVLIHDMGDVTRNRIYPGYSNRNVSRNRGKYTTYYEKIEIPLYAWWCTLCCLSLIVGGAASVFLPPDPHPDAYPLADLVVMYSTVADALSMVPQINVVAQSERQTTPGMHSFIGVLCLGRFLRMAFWAVLVLHYSYKGSSVFYLGSFILPDIVHTAVVADYLFLWVEKVRRESLLEDPPT